MLEGEIRIEARAGKWSVELNGAAGRRHALVDPLRDEDLAAVPNLIPDARSWQGLVERFSPSGWRVPLSALRQVGGLIRTRLLGWERAQAWFAAMEQKARQQGRMLRFVIDLDESMEDLALTPIELAFDGSEWLFKRRREPSVRVDANLESVPLSRIHKGDRLLVATAHSDRVKHPTHEELRAHAEAILKVARDAGWRAEWLEDASPRKLEAALTRGPPIDVLYVACHGEEDAARSGRLVLRGEKGDESLAGDTLAKWAADQADRGHNLKAVLLSACSSATPGGAESGGTAGMAQWLLKRGKVLAAMGYRKPVGITWALGFAERMLALLQEEQSLEEAFAEVRWNQEDADPQWALPLLYTRRWDAGTEGRYGVTTPAQPLTGTLPPLESLLPRPPRSYFTARQTELTELRRWLETPGRAVITAVAGEGGIGKTELATVLAYECHEAGRPIIWRERPLDNLRETLLTLIRAREPSFQPPPEASDDDLATRVRNLLSPCSGLLVLDDVSDTRGLDALMPGGHWNVLVTTRTAGLLSDVRDVSLRSLEPEDAARLLSLVAWRQEEVPPEEVEAALELVKELGGLPLAVEVAGDTIRTQGVTAAEYLEEFRTGRGRAGSDRDRVARVLTRSLGVLGEQARETLQALAVLPRVGASLEMAATTLDLREPEAARRLDRLVRHHLATFLGEQGLYAIHPRVRERLRDDSARDKGVWNRLHRGAAKALKNLVEWVEAPLGSSVASADERWRTARERFNSTDLSAWQEGVDGGEHIAQVLVAAEQFRQNDWSVAARAQALEFAETLARQGEQGLRAQILKAHGDLRLRQDEWETAAQDYSAALALFEAVGDRRGQGNTLKARGDLQLRQSELEAAAKDYSAALALLEAVGDRRGQGNTLKARGDLRLWQDELEAAAPDYSAALALLEAVGDRRGQANTLKARGDLRRRQDECEAAAQDYSAALALFEAVSDRFGQANTLQSRGDLWRRQEEWEAAAQDYSAALTLVEAVGSRLVEANILKSRGDLRLLQEEWEAAAQDYSAALALYEAVGSRVGQANTLRARGDLRRRQKEWEAAAQDYNAALALYEAVGSRLGQANTLKARGDLFQARKEWAYAEEYYLRARDIYTDIRNFFELANVLAEMVRVHVQRGRRDEALALIQEGLPIAEKSRNTYALQTMLGALNPTGREG